MLTDEATWELRRGTVIGGRFEVQARTGKGGMGAVFRADDRLTGAWVALKVLHNPDPSAEGRFKQESALLATLDHPAIVRYVAHGTLIDGRPWLAMEWLEGQELRARLARQGLRASETIELVRKVADALGAVHARGIVHRDVKPSNILLIENDPGRPRLLDFGIARPVAEAMVAPEPLTEVGMVVGTLGYLAPEQARGARDVGPAADVFALGVLLYRCLTGRAPFEAPNAAAALSKIILDEPPRLRELRPELPPELDALIARMMAKAPSARPQTGTEVATALAGIPLLGLIAGPGPSPQPSLTTGERRLVCVVVAQPAPEDPVTLDEADEARITAYGGHLATLADGSVVIVVSGRGTAADLATQAARCALQVRRVWEGPMALSTGRGTPGGRAPYGEVIDRAWSLLGRRMARGVVVDETTAGLLDGRFDIVSAAGGHVLRREMLVAGTRTLLGVATPCVGRERELAMLLGAWEGCVEGPEAQAVLVTAASGIGKSRVRFELTQRLSALPNPPAIWVGHGDPVRAGSPFALVAELLRAALGSPRSPAAVLAALAGRLTLAEIEEHAPFLGEVIDVPFDDESDARLRAARYDPLLMGDRMALAWETLLEADTRRGPVVMVLEDLQWGDLPTVRWIDRALRNLAERPLLVVAFARPEVHAAFPGLWDGRRLQTIQLGGLSRKSAERLARAVLGDRANAIADLVERADGNAFYLEELIRARALGAAALPESLLAMAQSRVESLEPEARRVLRAASIFGGSCWRGGLGCLLGDELSGRALDDWIDLLAARELLTVRTASSLSGETELVFRHALVREAAYAMLTDEDRVLGHRLAGAWLIDAGERDPLVLAEHFERGGDLAAAAQHYTRAAAAALEGNDLGAVIARAERAVACGAAGTVRGELYLLEAEARRWRGELAAADVAASKALAHLAPGTAGCFKAVGERGECLGGLSRMDELEALAREAQDIVVQPDAHGARAMAMARIALQLLFAGRVAQAETILMVVAEQQELLASDPLARGFVYRGLSNFANFQGDIANSYKADQQTVAAFEEAGDVRNRWRAINSLGFANLELGLYEVAEEQFADVIAEAERLGIGGTAALARQNLGLARGRLGDIAGGLELEQISCREFEAIGNPRLAAASRLYAAFLHLLAGDVQDALEVAEDAATRMVAANAPGLAYARAVQARALLGLGRPAEALEKSGDADDLLAALGVVDEGEAFLRLVHAQALRANGLEAQATRAIIEARQRLMDRAGRISKPELRRSFLEAVPEHRETLAWV